MEEKICNCHKMKKTPRTGEEKKALISRINRISGQFNGIKKMIEEDRYCEDVLIQLAAADKAVRSLSVKILDEHMRTCLTDEVLKGNTAVIDEMIELFRRFQ